MNLVLIRAVTQADCNRLRGFADSLQANGPIG